MAGVMLLCLSGCAILYSENPRRGRRTEREPIVQPIPPTKRGTAGRKGSLPWPVKGTVVGTYGSRVDPKYKTVTKSPGIDIAAANGAPVTAVDSGKVSFADHFLGYGRMVILDHGGRYHSIYSRLKDIRVSVGAIVKRGEPLGLAADTLHFEFRVGGKSVDPLDWLRPR